MKHLLVVLAILVVATTAMAGRSLEGSTVTLEEPALPLDPGQTYTFRFYVENWSEDYEYVADIIITFPDGYVLDEESIGWEEGPYWSYSSGNWNMQVSGTEASWLDADGEWGELDDYEDCYVFVDTTVPEDDPRDSISWLLVGDVYGEEPHEVSGIIELTTTPVDATTWGAIKALYR